MNTRVDGNGTEVASGEWAKYDARMLSTRSVFSLFITFAALASVALGQPSPTERVVLVQPIVVCDDQGNSPAPMRLREAAIDRAYSRAGIDFCFAEPITWNNTQARDGTINLEQIVRAATREGVMKGRGEILNMFFVNAVDGRRGPLGRGQQGGSIVFIALAEDERPSMEGFVLAHESGHCLGLIHSVDDPEVADDLVNLMGDGPFDERTAPAGLTASQIKTVQASALVRDRVWCLNGDDARAAILDETYEPFFSLLQRAEIAAFVQQSCNDASLERCRENARSLFQQAVLEFTPDETTMLNELVAALREEAAVFPMLTEQPWWFIKVRSDLCGGFAHTRGPYIILSDRYLDAMTRDRATGGDQTRWRGLLAHEQMHVLERLHPKRFATLFTEIFGFVQADVIDHPQLIERQVSNPDGLALNWVVPLTEDDGTTSYWWPRTILRQADALPVMGRDFEGIAVALDRTATGFTVRVNDANQPVTVPQSHLAPFTGRFNIRTGHDHPNEVAAYLMGRLIEEGLIDGDLEDNFMLAVFKRWCEQSWPA